MSMQKTFLLDVTSPAFGQYLKKLLKLSIYLLIVYGVLSPVVIVAQSARTSSPTQQLVDVGGGRCGHQGGHQEGRGTGLPETLKHDDFLPRVLETED